MSNQLSLYYFGLLIVIAMLFVVGVLTDVGGNSPFADLCRNLLVAIIAVFMGIPVALHIERQNRESENEAELRSLLSSIRDTLYNNVAFLHALYLNLSESLYGIPTYSLDLTTLEATVYDRHRLIRDPKLNDLIDRTQFELIHVQRRLDLLLEHVGDEFEGPSIDKSEFQAELLSQRETRRLGRFLESTKLSRSGLRFLIIRRGVIILVVGVTRVGDSSPFGQGGAVAQCATAIEAIDAVFPDASRNIRERLAEMDRCFASSQPAE